jgi:hypothetical protein
MSKKRKRNHNYCLSGTIEVYNITRGRRAATILNFDTPIETEIVENSGSIVTKSSIYDSNAPEVGQKKEIPPSGSCAQGETPLHSL